MSFSGWGIFACWGLPCIDVACFLSPFSESFQICFFFLLDEKHQRGLQCFQERCFGDFCRVTALFSWGFCVFLVDIMTAASCGSSGCILMQWGLDSTPTPAVQATSSRAGSVAALWQVTAEAGFAKHWWHRAFVVVLVVSRCPCLVLSRAVSVEVKQWDSWLCQYLLATVMQQRILGIQNFQNLKMNSTSLRF